MSQAAHALESSYYDINRDIDKLEFERMESVAVKDPYWITEGGLKVIMDKVPYSLSLLLWTKLMCQTEEIQWPSFNAKHL